MMSETLRSLELDAEATQAEQLERFVGDIADRLEQVRASLDRALDPDPA